MVLGHFGAIVVGSGAGGGTLAGVLARSMPAGKRVLLVERGLRFDSVDPTNAPRGLNTFNTQVGLTNFVKQGFEFLFTRDREFGFWQGVNLGGGTRHYNAIAQFPARDDFDLWESRRAPGGGLPGFRRRWEAKRDEAARLFHYEPNDPENEWSTNEERFAYGLRRLQYSGRAADFAIAGHPDDSVHALRGHNWIQRTRCVKCGQCIFTCRYEAKFGSYEACIRPAEQAAAAITVITGAGAKDVLLDAEGRAGGVVLDTAPGVPAVARAPLVVVSGGWFYTPTLLLNSGVSSAVNASGMLGKNLHTHPETFVLGVLDKDLRPRGSVEPAVQTMLRVPNAPEASGTGVGHPRFHDAWSVQVATAMEPLIATAALEVVRESGRPLATPRTLVGEDHKGVARVVNHRVMSTLNILFRPRVTGEVRADGAIDYAYAGDSDAARADRAAMQASIDFVGEVMEAAGARRILRGNVPNPIHSHHQFGTAVMGRDPAESVVAWGSSERSDFESWGVPGLFVVDSSIVPTAPFGFPSGTLFPIGLMAADVLRARVADIGLAAPGLPVH